ncbi:MAG: histidine kinase [Flavobacteriales bacterium]|nr:histidine kinase [Flavobacteriales bacterium]
MDPHIWPLTDSLITAWEQELSYALASGRQQHAGQLAFRLGYVMLMTENDSLYDLGGMLRDAGPDLQMQGIIWQSLGLLQHMDRGGTRDLLRQAKLEAHDGSAPSDRLLMDLALMRVFASERDTTSADSLAAHLSAPSAASDLAALDILLNQARVHLDAGDPTRARALYFEALSATDALGDPLMLGNAQLGIGWSYSDAGDNARAALWYSRALQAFRTAGHTRGLVGVLDALAYTYWGTLSPDQVLPYWQEALELARAEGMSRKTALIQLNLARFIADQDSLGLKLIGVEPTNWKDTAMHLVHQSQLGLLQAGDVRYFMTAKRIEAGILNHAGEIERSIAITRQLLDTARRRDDRQEVARTLVDIASNENALGHYPSAIRHLEEAIAIWEQTGVPGSLLNALPRYKFALERTHRYREALQVADRIKALGDSLRGIEVTDRLAQMDLKHRFAEEQLTDSLEHAQELALERRDREQQVARQRARTRMALGGGLVLLAASGALFLLDRRRRHERFARQAAQLETKALRAQMDPHFIGNTLHAVNAYLLANDAASASTLLSRFAKWIRITLESSRKEYVSLGEDLDAMRTYLALEQARTGDRFTFSIALPEEEELQHVRIPPMLVQPVLENAIVHGVLPLKGTGHIQLQVREEGDHLLITVEDNGVGRKAAPASESSSVKKSSLSARITRERLQLLSERTGQRADLRIVDLTRGTRVEIRLPFA